MTNREHTPVAPDENDLRWTCSERARGCDWTASEAFASDFIRGRSFERHHAEAREQAAAAQALRDAADDAVPKFNTHPLNSTNTVADWLRDRAAAVDAAPHAPNACCDYHRHIADGCCHCDDDAAPSQPEGEPTDG